jgi:general secretion pathway protein G
MNQRKWMARGGFTLLEILMVVVIIGFLVGIVAVNVPKILASQRIDAAKNQISAYTTALGVYEMGNSYYPTTEQGLNALLTKPGGGSVSDRWNGPYLQPAILRKDPWNREYIYRFPGVKNPTGYDLFSAGPDGVEGNEDDIGNWM